MSLVFKYNVIKCLAINTNVIKYWITVKLEENDIYKYQYISSNLNQSVDLASHTLDSLCLELSFILFHFVSQVKFQLTYYNLYLNFEQKKD